MDQDVEKLKEERPQGFQPPLMRTCIECCMDKGVSQFPQFHGSNQTCRKCLAKKSRARMMEANKPEDKFRDPQEAEIGQIVKLAHKPEPAHYIEAGGLRIQLCQSCLKRFLGI